MEIYIPKNFSFNEFLPKEVFNKEGILPEWFINPKIVWTMDKIRDRYGKPVIVNTWCFPGMQYFNYRGFRPADCNVGAELSQHKLGNAVDFNVLGMSAEEVQKDIQENISNLCFKYITCLELEPGVEKTHIDCRPFDRKINGLFLVKKRS